ncbi:MAG: glycerol-3-phosphate 1-O-acyltransferase PlsY [Candidatus Margulisiibacteriota bacterium]
MTINILLAIISAYLLGSIPFGYIIPRIWNIDIRRYGSGNIGATNVLRTIGPVAGTTVFILDLLKGAAAVLLAQQATQNPWLIILAGSAAVLGHTFPIFLRFKGGKGAATGLGFLLAVAPDIFLGALIVVILIVLITRYVSLASIITPILVTLAFYILKRPLPYVLVSGLISILITIRHIPNIKRLLARTEPKIGKLSTKSGQNKK